MTAIKRLIPNLFTAGNLVGGILAIIFTLNGRIDLAPYCIFVSAIFDFLDGFMARLLKVPSELGKQLDSLADMVTFGVAPGIIVFELYRINHTSTLNNELSLTAYGTLDLNQCYIALIGLVIPVFALFRLAKFNLDTRQTDSFIGVPTPAMTLYFASLPILIISGLNSTGWQYEMATEVFLNPWFLGISTIVLSVLMVAEIPLFALKFKHFKWKGNEIRFIFLTISVGMLAILFFWAVPLIIILYVILSLINNRILKTKQDE